MDAAIAANAVLGVVEPQSCGIGGDLFAIHWEAKTGKISAINASGWSPKALTIDTLQKLGHKTMPQEGIHAVTVPGAVDGWSKLHKRFGKLPWRDIFQPAIYFAENGYPVTELISITWKAEEAKLAKNANAAKVFSERRRAGRRRGLPQSAARRRLPRHRAGGRACLLPRRDRQGHPARQRRSHRQTRRLRPRRLRIRMGRAHLHRLPRLESLRAAAARAGDRRHPDAQSLFRLPSLHVRPARSRRAPHPDGGAEARLCRPSPLRRRPRLAKVPAPGMISMEDAERAKLIDPNRARCDVQPGNPPATGGDTIYLSAVDREGNIVSLIQSNYLNFGSARRGRRFRLPPAKPRRTLRPRPEPPQRPRPAEAPVPHHHPRVHGEGRRPHRLRHHGRLNQAQAHAQFVSNIADHGMNIQMALEAPRFTKTPGAAATS